MPKAPPDRPHDAIGGEFLPVFYAVAPFRLLARLGPRPPRAIVMEHRAFRPIMARDGAPIGGAGT